jgi:hypothetical protein
MRHEQQYGAMPYGYCALRPLTNGLPLLLPIPKERKRLGYSKLENRSRKMFIEFINRLSAQMARHNIFLYMFIGAITFALLVYFKLITTQDDIRTIIGLFSLPFMLIWIFGGWKCCVYFYGEQKFREIMPSRGGKNIGMPMVDKHFYEQITSNIKFTRKLAGYSYVFSKFITCFCLGSTMTFPLIFKLLTN